MTFGRRVSQVSHQTGHVRSWYGECPVKLLTRAGELHVSPVPRRDGVTGRTLTDFTVHQARTRYLALNSLDFSVYYVII